MKVPEITGKGMGRRAEGGTGCRRRPILRFFPRQNILFPLSLSIRPHAFPGAAFFSCGRGLPGRSVQNSSMARGMPTTMTTPAMMTEAETLHTAICRGESQSLLPKSMAAKGEAAGVQAAMSTA